MIRELNKSDLTALFKLYEHLHTEDAPLPLSGEIEEIWNGIQLNPNLMYFGVFSYGFLVSSCTLYIVPNLTRGCRPNAIIENVVTHINFRRQGHGRDVLKHALAEAWSRGCYKVMLLTGRRDEGVYQFYESVGFGRKAKQAFLAKPQ